MKLALPATGPGVSTPTFLGVVLLVDLLGALGAVLVGPLSTVGGLWPSWPAGFAWAISAYGAAVGAADLAAARMKPAGLTWRRRLVYVAILAVVWRNGPFGDRAVALPLVLWSGLVWVALVVGGRALSRAIASATGEDGPE